MRTAAIPMKELAQLLQVQLQHDGKTTLTVTGCSMYPLFRHQKDTVFLKLPQGNPRKKDIILYLRANGQYVLHRIVRVVEPGMYLCAGDNQWKTEQVSAEQVIAVVYGFCRKGKTYDLRGLAYRLYAWAWVGMLPVRRPVLALRRAIGAVKYRIVKGRQGK